MYQAIVSPEVAKLRPGDTGTHNVLLAGGQVLTLTRQPTYLAKVPPEVETDPHVLVTELAASDWTAAQKVGATETELRPERLGEKAKAAPAPAAADAPAAAPPPIPADLAEVEWNALRTLASSHGLAATGKREEIEARLEKAKAASAPADDDAPAPNGDDTTAPAGDDTTAPSDAAADEGARG